MAINIIAPKREQELIDQERRMTLRTARFFEQISTEFADLPIQGVAVADASGETAAGNEAAINALLASLRTAELIAT